MPPRIPRYTALNCIRSALNLLHNLVRPDTYNSNCFAKADRAGGCRPCEPNRPVLWLDALRSPRPGLIQFRHPAPGYFFDISSK